MSSISTSTNSINSPDDIIIRANLRPIFVSYTVPPVCAVVVIVTLFLPIDEGIKFGIWGGFGFGIFASLFLAINYHIKLKTAKYIISAEYVEMSVRKDIFTLTTRRIPLAYIRDLTLQQSFFQSFFDLCNITVATTNGDKIILENLSDGRRAEAAIWKLVLAHSPAASHNNPMD